MKKALQEEIELHKKLSQVYDYRYEAEFSKMYLAYWNDVMSECLPKNKKQSVLECGCGTGPFLKDLVKVYKSVVGMDSSIDMLKKIPIEQNNLKITVGDIENLQFKDKVFDIVICRETLHHVPRPQTAFCEISRILKPGGIFILSEACDDSVILRLPRLIFYTFSSKFGKNHKSFSSNQLKDYSENVNFFIEKTKYLGYIGLPLCIMPDFFPILKYIPFKRFITRALISIDKFLAKVPFLKKQAFDIIIQAKKSKI